MGIFDSLFGGGPQIQNGSRMQARRQNPMQMLFQLKRNPAEVLRQAGFSIPANIRDPGDGSGYINYLYQSGQVDNGILQTIQNAAGGRRR